MREICFVYRTCFLRFSCQERGIFFIRTLGAQVAAISTVTAVIIAAAPLQQESSSLRRTCFGAMPRVLQHKEKASKKTSSLTYSGGPSKFSDLKENVSLGDLSAYIHHPFLFRVLVSVCERQTVYFLYLNLTQKLGYNILIGKKIALIMLSANLEGRYPKGPLKFHCSIHCEDGDEERVYSTMECYSLWENPWHIFTSFSVWNGQATSVHLVYSLLCDL